ncbi:MAG: transporter [Vicinamibacteria bacterium]
MSIRVHRALLVAFFGLQAFALASRLAVAQELEPGAYSISPVGVNVVVVTDIFTGGDVTFDPALPIEDAEAKINTTVVAYVRSLGLFGRSANVGMAVPFSVGHLEGIYIGEFTEVERSGFRDPQFRFAVNLLGAPDMTLQEFASYRQKTNMGVCVVVAAPLGEYDPSKLVNLGTNRWSFKPEVGLSRAMGKWTLDVYAGAWVFTDNKKFFGGKTREQDPIGSMQLHLLYTVKPRMWASFDANFYTGGRTTVDGRLNLDLQRNSRLGGTFALPLNRRQSLKFSYSRGAYTTIGADFHAVAVGYQYLWGAGL